MGKENKVEAAKKEHPEKKVFWIVGVGIMALVGAPSVFMFFFHDLDGGGPSDWAIFATYFSGVATPVVALCSALLFFRSIVVQRRESAETRDEMKKATLIHQRDQEHRFNLQEQEQIDRALPIAWKKLDNFYFILETLYDALKSGEDGHKPMPRKTAELLLNAADSRLTVEAAGRSIEHYARLALHVTQRVYRYMEVGGDMYLRLDDINKLIAQYEVYQKLKRHIPVQDKSLIEKYQSSYRDLLKKQTELFEQPW